MGTEHMQASYRPLTPAQRDALIVNGTTAENWSSVLVTDGFDPDLIRSSHFFGRVEIGLLTKGFTGKNGITLPIGIYYSAIGDCRIGDNAAIHHASYCAGYHIGSNALLLNTGDISLSVNPRFGTGIHSRSRSASPPHKINLVNENGGRAVIPFPSMTVTDAYIWAKYRGDIELLKKFESFTQASCVHLTNSPGVIGDSALIKNVKTISDAHIGDYAIVDGAERLESVFVHSNATDPTRIGNGVQLIGAIVGFGSRIDSGAQLESVVTGSSVSIERCARISHSYIGDNAAIACGEVAHALIAPFHAQHHNNSFLIAAMAGGQSNIAAGATIGSNHTSRVNDGELWAHRGFWPGLCVSLKHNSRFASFTMLVKGDFPAELDIPFPFSLVLNDSSTDSLLILPAFWFTNNMYAFMRSSMKFRSRDRRKHRAQVIEHDALAPDTVEEIFSAIDLLAELIGDALHDDKLSTAADKRLAGFDLLQNKPGDIRNLEILGSHIERGHRKVHIRNVAHAWTAYRCMLRYYAATTICRAAQNSPEDLLAVLLEPLPAQRDTNWLNCGGQVMRTDDFSLLLNSIKTDSSIANWDKVHELTGSIADGYPMQRVRHALSCLATIDFIEPHRFDKGSIAASLTKALPLYASIASQTRTSRYRDFSESYRKMIYDSDAELQAVLGDLESDPVIVEVDAECSMTADCLKKIISELTSDQKDTQSPG